MESFDVGPGWLHPYEDTKFRLRFALGGEVYSQITHVVPRFIQALERSRVLADHVFGDARAMAIVGSWTLAKGEIFKKERQRGATGYALLETMGFSGARMLSAWREKPAWFDQDDPGDGVPFDWKAYDITGLKAMRDTLLWASNAVEIGIEPSAPVVPYLFSPVSGVVMHVYDDRGADIMALSPEPLMSLYRDFHPWILDEDRPRILEAFGAPAPEVR